MYAFGSSTPRFLTASSSKYVNQTRKGMNIMLFTYAGHIKSEGLPLRRQGHTNEPVILEKGLDPISLLLLIGLRHKDALIAHALECSRKSRFLCQCIAQSIHELFLNNILGPQRSQTRRSNESNDGNESAKVLPRNTGGNSCFAAIMDKGLTL